MCGIFGAVTFAEPFGANDFERFQTLTNLVRHRGPDACGHAVLQDDGIASTQERFTVFLGHRRLAIVDPNCASNQPLQGDLSSFITFNGEIFDYCELRRQLIQLGHSFRTNGDAEVILHVYQQWGASGFGRMNGEWAFAIADVRRRRVVLSRDRFSVKPLYYWTNKKRFYFASEIKQLLPLLPKVEPNLEILHTYLRQGITDAREATFYKNVRRVRPRHNLIISLDDGSVAEQCYWEFSPFEEPQSDEQAAEELRQLLRDSICIRLPKGVGAAGMLSGGLDSSIICTTAREMQREAFQTFTVVPDVDEYSEVKFVDHLVEQSGLSNRRLVFDSGQALQGLHEVIERTDEPPAGFSSVAFFKMMQLIRRESDVKVVLSGQGADEAFLGYRKFHFFALAQMVRDGRATSAMIEAASSFLRGTALRQFHLGEARRYLPECMNLTSTFVRTDGNIEPLGAGRDIRLRQIADIEHYSVPSLTRYEDSNAMAFGIEVRLPFLDYRVVDLALRLPLRMKIRRGWSKYLLRSSFPELPPAIRWRVKKSGFTLPDGDWLRKDFAPLIRRVFESSLLADAGVINDRQLLGCFESFRTNPFSVWSNDIAHALFAELWMRKLERRHEYQAPMQA
jgi:asparagine synthase (glutamine-hydrolysing)